MKVIYALFFALLPLLVAGCGAKKYHLTASPSVPAAQGNVQVSTDNNGNRSVKLEAEHLAEPTSLTPPGTAYVVWIQRRGGTPENEGQIKVSNNLKASFETVTPYKDFEIFVTAEPNPTVKTPSGPEVLRASVQG